MFFWTLFRRIKQNNQGVSALEFAFVAPVFLMFLAAIINFGMAYLIKNQMQVVARDTSRQFAVGALSEVQAENYALGGLPNPVKSACKLSIDQKTDTCSGELLVPQKPGDGSNQATGTGIRYSVDVVPPGPNGTDVTTIISAPMADVTNFDMFGVFNGTIRVSVTMRVE